MAASDVPSSALPVRRKFCCQVSQVGPDFVLVDMRAGHSCSEELLVSSR